MKKLLLLCMIVISACHETRIEEGNHNQNISPSDWRPILITNGFDKKERIAGKLFAFGIQAYYRLLFKKDNVYYMTLHAYSVKQIGKNTYAVYIWKEKDVEPILSTTWAWIDNYELAFENILTNELYYFVSDIKLLTKYDSKWWVRLHPDTKIWPF